MTDTEPVRPCHMWRTLGTMGGAAAFGAGLPLCRRPSAAESAPQTTTIAAPSATDDPNTRLSHRDEVAHSWGDLMRLVGEKDTHVPSLGGFRSQMLYRGASSCSWEPLTSLQRLDHPVNETPHIEVFVIVFNGCNHLSDQLPSTPVASPTAPPERDSSRV